MMMMMMVMTMMMMMMVVATNRKGVILDHSPVKFAVYINLQKIIMIMMKMVMMAVMMKMAMSSMTWLTENSLQPPPLFLGVGGGGNFQIILFLGLNFLMPMGITMWLTENSLPSFCGRVPPALWSNYHRQSNCCYYHHNDEHDNCYYHDNEPFKKSINVWK